MQILNSHEVKVTKEMREILVGRVSEYRDPHGNPQFYATSAATDDEGIFWTKGGAELWLRLQGLLYA